MNKLVFPNGGMPLELDDLDFMQEASKEAILGCVHEFARQQSGFIILSGMSVTGASAPYDVSEGYAMINYEICYFPAQTSTDAVPSIGLDDTFDSAGNDVFFDGISRDTYNVRRAKVVSSGTPSSFLMADSRRLTTIMKSLIVNPTEIVQTDSVGVKYDFVVGDLETDVAFNGAFLPYAIKKNGRVKLYGTVLVGASKRLTAAEILTLPAGFRPTNTGQLRQAYIVSADDSLISAEITSAFKIKQSLILSAGVLDGEILSLNGISFDVES